VQLIKQSSVDESYSDVRKEVASRVAKDISNLDFGLLRNQVKEEAKQLVIDKFNNNLDSLLNDFNQNLTNVAKIYESISDNMVGKQKETVFKIGI